jgi:tripartite-type tricarboxylate transporter receptor subunit TctC
MQPEGRAMSGMAARVLMCWLLLLLCAGMPCAHAQVGEPGGFPARAVRLVVPYATGGGTDAVARILADVLAQRWGQSVIVDNRPGAGGTLGAAQVAQSVPDGLTLLVSPLDLLINALLVPNLPYDPLRDFVPVGPLVSTVLALAASSASGIDSMATLFRRAGENPGSLAFASCGNGTPQHIAGELLKSIAHIDLVHVPYKGCGPAQTDLLAGQVPLMFGAAANLVPYAHAGRLVPLAILAGKRFDALPGVPTVTESGLDGLVIGNWMALLAPARVPAPILGRLQATLQAVHRDPVFARRIAERGFEQMPGSPESLRSRMLEDLQTYGRLVRQGGARTD